VGEQPADDASPLRRLHFRKRDLEVAQADAPQPRMHHPDDLRHRNEECARQRTRQNSRHPHQQPHRRILE